MIKQLEELLKSSSWLRINCILSAGVFYFEPPCTCHSVLVCKIILDSFRTKGQLSRLSFCFANITRSTG